MIQHSAAVVFETLPNQRAEVYRETREEIRRRLEQHSGRMMKRDLLRKLLGSVVRLMSDVTAAVAAMFFTVFIADTFHLGEVAGGFWVSEVLTVLGSVACVGAYKTDVLKTSGLKLFGAGALAASLLTWQVAFLEGSFDGLFLLLVRVSVTASLLVGLRRAVEIVSGRVLRLQITSVPTIMVGTPHDCEVQIRGSALSGESYYRTVETVHIRLADTHLSKAETIVDSLVHALDSTRAGAVVLCSRIGDELLQGIIAVSRSAGCELLSIPRDFRVTGSEPRLFWRDGLPFVQFASGSVLMRHRIVKRCVDVSVSVVGLIVLMPLLCLLAIAIKLDSKGPVFYGSDRWGMHGHRIRIWKFRTMMDGAAAVLEADQELNRRFATNIKLQDDPRVTKVGWFLRKLSLDEIPQLLNVLMGEMSLVGPRPKLLGESDKYGAALDTVLSVRPGMTGLWQVSGRNNTSYEERINLDVQYAMHTSIWMDFSIMLRTVPVVLTGHGAQ